MAKVWSAKTTISTMNPAAAIGASTGSQPLSRARLRSIWYSGRAATRNGATAISAVGVAASANAAPIRPRHSGSSRRVTSARSTAHSAISEPSAAHGSGRTPLLNGIHQTRNTVAAAQLAPRLLRTWVPSLGITSRLISSQLIRPSTNEGSRIHGGTVDTVAISS